MIAAREKGSENRGAQWRFVCQNCAAEFPFGPQISGCANCRGRSSSGLLELVLSYCGSPPAPHERSATRGLLRYLDVLLPIAPESWISLGEGSTALVRSQVVGRAMGFKNLWFKLEQQNPTLSFKDRYVSASINAARSFGYRRVAVSSTGNLGLSAAAYCAAAGMECLVIVPDDTPENVITEASLYGARVAVLSKSIRFRALEFVAEQSDWFALGLFLNRAVQNPFGVEGYKTIAYETVEALADAPAAILFPCARGNGLYGTWKGFKEALSWGWARHLPRVVACQPAGANSLEISLQRGSPTAVELAPVESVAKSTTETVASDKALQAIRESRGTALSANDEEIIAAVKLLGREGLNVEAGSALPVACLPRLRASLDLSPDDPIVCVLTATGLRWPIQSRWWPTLRIDVDGLGELAIKLRLGSPA